MAFDNNDAASPTQFKLAMTAIAIFAGSAANALMFDALPPIMVPIAEHFGGGERGRVVAQLASTLPLFGVTLSGLVAGIMIESQGIRRTLLIMLLLFGAGGSTGLFIDSAFILLGCRLCLGFATGMMMTSCASLVAAKSDAAARARMNGWMLSVGSFCSVLFILISGQLASLFSWRAPFAFHAVLTLFFLLPVLLLDEVRIEPLLHDAKANFRRLKPVVPVFVLAFCLYTGSTSFFVQFPFLLAGAGVTSASVVARIFAVNAAIGMCAAYACGRWVLRITPMRVVKLGFTLLAIAFALAAYASTVPVFTVAIALMGAAVGMAQPALWTRAMQLAPPDLAPRALGFTTSSLYIGGSLCPLVVAPIRMVANSRETYVVFAAVIVTLIAIAQLYAPRGQTSVT